MWSTSIGNPYRSPVLPVQRQPSCHRQRRFWLRFRRFTKRRWFVLACALVGLGIIDAMSLRRSSEIVSLFLYPCFATFLFANECRFAWIAGKTRAIRAIDWSYHWEVGASCIVVGLKVGGLYPCLCSSLSGELVLKNYWEFAAIFGVPILVALLFVFVRRTIVATALAASFVVTLWMLQPSYTEWIHS